MITPHTNGSIRRLYWMTASFGIAGFVSYLAAAGPLPALGFLLGALASFGNLWLFEWLAKSIAPRDAPRKPWQTGAFVSRYLILFTFGYVIVRALGINPLAVVLGLLASTAAVLLSSTIEIFQSFRRSGRTN